ncbi:MAG: hypothetical protein WC438_00595 [Candidatus Pacearchaeota archaeon]
MMFILILENELKKYRQVKLGNRAYLVFKEEADKLHPHEYRELSRVFMKIREDEEGNVFVAPHYKEIWEIEQKILDEDWIRELIPIEE